MTNFAISPKIENVKIKLVQEKDWGWKIEPTDDEKIEHLWERLYCGWENGEIDIVAVIDWLRREGRREFELMERFVKSKRKAYAH